MYLMRIGAVGAEKPVARLDDQTYVDLSDLVDDLDERFFGEGDRSTSAAAARHELGLELTTLCLFLQRGLGRLGSATSSAAAAAGLETGS